MKIALVVFVGLAIYIILHVLNQVRQQTLQNEWVRRFLKVLPLVEFSSWVGFVFWSVSEFFFDQPYYIYLLSVLIIVLVILIAWFLGRDYIAGIILKAQNVFKPGQSVTIGSQQGTIKRMGNLHLTLRTGTGDKAHIPYSTLSHTTIIQETQNDISIHVITFELSNSITAEEWTRKIRNALVISPFVFNGSDSLVVLKPKTGGYMAEVRTSTLTKEHALHLEKKLTSLGENY